jgi:hypothetical protein
MGNVVEQAARGAAVECQKELGAGFLQSLSHQHSACSPCVSVSCPQERTPAVTIEADEMVDDGAAGSRHRRMP